MSLTVETDGAAALVDALASGDPRPAPAAVDAALGRNEFFLAVYASMGVERETLRELALDAETAREHDLLDQLRTGFAEAARSPDAVRTRLGRLGSLDPDRIGDRAGDHLPGETSLDRTVHATIDGFNGGVQFRGDVGVSVVGRTTETLDAVVAHELHHAGLFGLLEQRPIGAVLDADGPEADAVEALVTLQAEGYAIAYAQGGLAAVGGEEMTAAVEQFRERERDTFAAVETALNRTLRAATPEDRAATLRSIVVDETGAYAPVHYVGARMVEIADRVHGHDEVVAAATAPDEFLELYRTATKRDETYRFRFDPAVIDRLTAAVS